MDLYSDAVNANLPAKSFAGRSVACVDRKGTGRYSIAVATYSYRGEGMFTRIWDITASFGVHITRFEDKDGIIFIIYLKP